MPSWGTGSEKRFNNPDLERTKKLPAPDAYECPSMLGPQASSSKRSAPLAGFGSSTRDHMAKVFMSPEHEKINSFGKGSPGPAVYDRERGIGKQLLSVRREAPSFGFGGCDRCVQRAGRQCACVRRVRASRASRACVRAMRASVRAMCACMSRRPRPLMHVTSPRLDIFLKAHASRAFLSPLPALQVVHTENRHQASWHPRARGLQHMIC
jgi:hypothetical protein